MLLAFVIDLSSSELVRGSQSVLLANLVLFCVVENCNCKDSRLNNKLGIENLDSNKPRLVGIQMRVRVSLGVWIHFMASRSSPITY